LPSSGDCLTHKLNNFRQILQRRCFLCRLRLLGPHFVCFVVLIFMQGCDASILLDTNYATQTSEIASSGNFAIRNRETINDIKSVLEEECPGQVSCADIIVLAAKVSVSLSGGPSIQVPFGRKDSRTSSSKEADAKLPSPTVTVDEFLSIFKSKGMNIQESVAILGNALHISTIN